MTGVSLARSRVGNAQKLPYSNQLKFHPDASLIVLCGSKAWHRAELRGWFPGCKVVFPIDQHPQIFDWRVASEFYDSIIWSFGDQPEERVSARIAAQLLRFHERVLLMHEGNLIAAYKPMQAVA